MTKTPSSDAQSAVLLQKLTRWQNTLFDAQVDVELAEMLGDDPMGEQSRDRMKSALKAIKFVENKLGELTGGE